jgi:hypothetical protein
MTSADEAGSVLLEELKWVHNLLRAELQALPRPRR